MRIIAVTNQKGGVGKTTTTANLAAALAKEGRKVILIDLDPQAHLTTFLGVSPFDVALSSYELLCQNKKMSECLVDIRDNMKLLSSGINLTAAEQELVSVVGRETILRDAITNYENECDYVLIDCPPSLGMLTLNALGAAREIFIPMQPHFLSLQGLSQLLESVTLVQQRINRELAVTGLLYCMFDSRLSLSNEVVGEIEDFVMQHREVECPWQKVRLFDTRIRRNVKLAESPSYGQTIFEYENSSNGADDYRSLAAEVLLMECGDPLVGQTIAKPEPESQAQEIQPTDQPVNEQATESCSQQTQDQEPDSQQESVPAVITNPAEPTPVPTSCTSSPEDFSANNQVQQSGEQQNP